MANYNEKSNAEIMAEGSRYVMNTYGRLPIAMVKGEGCHVWDADGKKYLDFVAGVAVNSVGHCHPQVVRAVSEQVATLMHCSNLYWIAPQVELAKILVENSQLDKVFFCNSGAEANEGAIKLARKAAKEIHQNENKYEIITMLNSFHGRTLATLTATGQDKVKTGFAPLPQGFKYVPYNDINALKEAISDITCAVMMEPVQGEGGVIAADDEYLKQVRELCNEKGVLLIFDEVQVGIGRTGKLFAYEHSGVVPDIMTLAKALGGGAPIGAVMAKDEIAEHFGPGTHATTFGGNPLVTSAGVAAMTVMLEEDLPGNAAEMGKYMEEKFHELQAEYDFIKETRGKGLLLGLNMAVEGGGIVKSCLEKGLLINCTAGTVLRFVPPLNVTKSDIDECIAILKEALDEVK